jgi:hypothetical protein
VMFVPLPIPTRKKSKYPASADFHWGLVMIWDDRESVNHRDFDGRHAWKCQQEDFIRSHWPKRLSVALSTNSGNPGRF